MRHVRRPGFGILVAVLTGLSVDATLGVVFCARTTSAVCFAVFCAVALVALQLGYLVRPAVVGTWARIALVLLAQALLTWAPMLVFGPHRHGLTGVFAGSALLLLPTAVGWPVLLVVVVVVGSVEQSAGAGPLAVWWAVSNVVVTALVVYGLSWLVRLVAGLHAARHDLSRLAVARERLRCARDVHDLLGLSLSAITLKTELSARLVTDCPARARTELEDVQEIARRALAEVRSVAVGRSAGPDHPPRPGSAG
ncbi:histidine kinase [Amycolatopsis albispora]|uniref:Signal transduction histidine kinase subgroup 3 dimerisation and phosphoacceptor domain-containing protein n=1 Tax=Amycolatopsis albispora TaxID=1804986 RepID=A0A344LH47_9PSEU|nr:histidine kinase dimerization/phosphoacceptor domain-containing protein [Amycolatopsis albispora]AXB47371.1 hypothetical protein A4R43_37040 [Amycolatopsis albispora]